MVQISGSSLSGFLARRPFSIVHVDANWDGDRKALADKICVVESQFEESVSFGYVDCDEEEAYANSVAIVNVPAIAYYRGMDLFGVVIGIRQDVAGNIVRVMNAQPLDQSNRDSRG